MPHQLLKEFADRREILQLHIEDVSIS